MLITLNQLKSALQAVVEKMMKISERIPTKVSDLDNDLPSPDWQESDQSSPAYIENRTHWEEKSIIPLIKVDNVQISGRAPVSIGTAYETLEVGDTIIFNGNECTATASGETIQVYNENTDLYLIFYPDHSVKLACGTNGTYNVDAKLVSKTVHKLDNEYLNLDTELDSTSDNPVANKAVSAVLYGKVSDVQVNGTSVVNDGVANIPISSTSEYGAVKVGSGLFIQETGSTAGTLNVYKAAYNEIKTGNGGYKPITPDRQHHSVFYGLATAAGDTTQSQSSNAVGTYTDEAKTAIKSMLGVPNNTYDLGQGELLPANADLNNYREPGVYYADDSVVSTILHSPTTNPFKLVVEKTVGPSGSDFVKQILTNAQGNSYVQIIGTRGDGASSILEWRKDVLTSDILVNDVQVNGTSILSNGTANIPVANNTLGVVKVNTGTNSGIYINPVTGEITTSSASIANIKEGTNLFRPLSPGTQHGAAFYGLAKAAGDTTQASSDNAVGTYTDAAKTAIKSMLDIPNGGDYVTKDSVNNAGITGRTYTELFNGEFSVTTATTSGYLKPYARASVTGRFNKENMHRVTINGTEYTLQTRMWYEASDTGIKVYEYLGNLNYYISDVSGVPGGTDNVPFLIVSDLNNNSSIDVLTNSAGTYTIKVEKIVETKRQIPRSLLYNNYYEPILKKDASGSTYNGFSIGVNELNNSRATFAFGYGNKISDEFSTAIGVNNAISGRSSIAIGGYNDISGKISKAIGIGLIANSNNLTVLGSYNLPANTALPLWDENVSYKKGDIVVFDYEDDPDPVICTEDHVSHADISENDYWVYSASNGDSLLIVGGGISPIVRRNAFKLSTGGRGYFSGDVYVRCEDDSTGGQKLATEDYVNSVAVISDVQIDGTSILNNGVANIPKASTSSLGLITTTSSQGLNINHNSGTIYINDATSAQIKSADSEHKPVTTQRQHESVFYGLAKAAGDTTQSVSENAVGTYTDSAKAAIRTMIGAVGSTDYASGDSAGVVKISTANGIGINANGTLYIYRAQDSEIKSGNVGYRPIVSQTQHMSVFYGLAKAAGDTTQSQSNNAVGVYTPDAQTAIKDMLGIEEGSANVVTLTDSTITIDGEPNTRYNCGEVVSITINPPAVGTIDVRFTSGSTLAVLTLPSTVKMPEWWAGVEIGYTYEIIITDGVYAGVMAWPM